jgi:hypothetical protein
MEEILASIRRIISEDDAPATEEGEALAAAAEEPAAVAAPEAEPEVAAAPEPEPEPPAPEPQIEAAAPEEEELELTEKVETLGDLDVFSPEAASAEAEAAPPPPAARVETLVSDRAATAAATAFGQLSAAITMPKGDRTLEDVVRELLRPMLQQWLDDNLPGIVQQAVEAEVDRIARSRVR